jgi:Fibronectin type III domain
MFKGTQILTKCNFMKIKNYSLFIFTTNMIMLVALLSSCVGTIKDVNPIVSRAVSSKDSSIQNYAGIEGVKAVANTKVEVYFGAVTGDTDQIAYVIRYSGQQIPTYIQATALKPDYRGLLKYTVTGLQTDTKYDFTVQARNIVTGAESTNSATKGTRTFANATANFGGITQVRNLPGADGLNGIEVFWSEAETKGGIVTKDEIDPIEYKITVINGNALNPGNMNDTSFGEPLRKTYSVSPTKRSSVVNGLNLSTKYYVQVRAIHHGQSLNSGDTSYKVEENTNYLEISTYSDDIANLNFDYSSFGTSFPPGATGLYAINTSWAPPEGNFDHYRIYYALNGSADIDNYLRTQTVNPFCFGPELANTNIMCEYAEFNKSSRILTGLTPNSKYDLILVVCLTTDCSASKRVSSAVRSHTTTPNLASFSGITSIDIAKNLSQLDKLFLNYNAPDFNSGNISGFIVEYYGSDTNNPAPVQLNQIGTSVIDGIVTNDPPNTSGLLVDDFDYLENLTISVSGVDPTSILPYCFLVYPFTYNNDGSKNLFKSGLTPRCQVPNIVGPRIESFPGLANTTCATADREAILSWSAPSGSGVFNNYEFYYAKNQPSFSFGSAITLAGGYNRIIVNSAQTSVHLTDLEPGAEYKFGVLTRYQSINGVIRSEFNANIGTCTF